MAAVLTKAAPMAAAAEQEQKQEPLVVPLPCLIEPYEPCTFDYEAHGIDRAASDERGVSLQEWIDVFRHSTPTFCRHIEHGAAHEVADAITRAALATRFAQEFPAALDAALAARRRGVSDVPGTDPATGRVTCISLCHLRDGVLRGLGLRDIFRRVKREEDAAALRLLPGVLQGLDAAPAGRPRLELAVRGVLAGNVFDLGAAASAELFEKGEGGGAEAFCRTRDERLLPRPWAVDDLDALLDTLLPLPERGCGGAGAGAGNGGGGRAAADGAPAPAPAPPPYDRAVLFADNAGSDVLLGLLPLARELLRLGVPSVVLAANSAPTLNDTTAEELGPLLAQAAEHDPDPALLPCAVASGALRVVASGNGLPVVDLRRCSRALADEFFSSTAAADGEKEGGQKQGREGGVAPRSGGDRLLLVLEGMGRGIETNLKASFSCDALRIGVIKHPEVARLLGGRLYDPVVRFTRVE